MNSASITELLLQEQAQLLAAIRIKSEDLARLNDRLAQVNRQLNDRGESPR